MKLISEQKLYVHRLCHGGVVYIMASSLLSMEETGAVGREIESRKVVIGW
jgi:hypothetical protein